MLLMMLMIVLMIDFDASDGNEAHNDGFNAYDAFDDLVKVCKGRQTLVKHQLWC